LCEEGDDFWAKGGVMTFPSYVVFGYVLNSDACKWAV